MPALAAKLGREIRRCASARAGAAHPNNKSLALFAQNREGRTVDALCTEHVDVVKLGELFRGESFCRSIYHVACVVNRHIEPSILIENLPHGAIRGFL